MDIWCTIRCLCLCLCLSLPVFGLSWETPFKEEEKKQGIQEQPTNPLLFFSPGPRQESKQNNVPLVLMYAP
jgi:hypothetical protein